MRAASLRLLTASAALVLAVTAAAPAAHAVESFPPSIARDLALGYAPPCRLCHIQGTTGAGSVASPFGISMLARGLTQDRSTLSPALAALRTDGTDSDGDGKPDVDELIANTDPNTPVDVALVDTGPKYGCDAAGDARPRGLVDLLAVLAVGAALRPGRRRRAL